jgi:dihydrofolate synthase/folylpolyglutamate synthase
VSAIVHLVEVLKGMDFRPRTLVLSFMRDKKVEEMLSPLSEVSDRLIATEVPMPRCLPAEELARRALGVFGEVAVNPDPVKALREAASSGSVLITGSFYLAGEVLRGLRAPVCKGA